jgi:hypothetical protein
MSFWDDLGSMLGISNSSAQNDLEGQRGKLDSDITARNKQFKTDYSSGMDFWNKMLADYDKRQPGYTGQAKAQNKTATAREDAQRMTLAGKASQGLAGGRSQMDAAQEAQAQGAGGYAQRDAAINAGSYNNILDDFIEKLGATNSRNKFAVGKENEYTSFMNQITANKQGRMIGDRSLKSGLTDAATSGAMKLGSSIDWSKLFGGTPDVIPGGN